MLTESLLASCLLLFLFRSGVSLPMDSEIGRKAGELTWHWSADKFPNPQTEFDKCRQMKPSTICDPDGILTAEEAAQLGEMIKRVHNNSPCLCGDNCGEEADTKGVVIGIALMKNMEHPYHADLEDIAHNFSRTVMKNWNLGTCDNGILLFLSVVNKQPHIEPGSAVSNYLKDETIDEIFNQCKGHLDDGHYYQGLESMINSLYNSMQAKYRAPGMNEDEETGTGNIGLTVGLVVGFACLAGLFAAGLVFVRRRRSNANQDKFMYDGSSNRPGSRGSGGKRDSSGPIVKTPVVFPSAVYQPCSVEDGLKTGRGEYEDEEGDNEEQYLRNLEENPAYEAADTMTFNRTLSVVQEQSPENSPQDTIPPVSVHQKNNLNRFQAEHKDVQM